MLSILGDARLARGSEGVSEMFIARQPIFNRDLEVFGYELLFRSDSDSSQYDGGSSQSATAAVIEGIVEHGLNKIVEGKSAFVNFDEEFIHSNGFELIASEHLVIEILENVKVDEALMCRIRELKNLGYKIALDDFVEDYEQYPLVEFADIIKFDLIATPIEGITECVKKALSQHKILLAEKLETREDFLKARSMGFSLFQGYFFSKPRIIGKVCEKRTPKIQYMRMLTELKKEEPSYRVLSEIISKDVNLAYRLMRVVSVDSNKDQIYSIKRALTFMGFRQIERWVNILMVRDLGNDKPQEIMRISLVRSQFAERITLETNLKSKKSEAAMMGLFSTLDAVLDEKMEDALKGMSLSTDIIEALIHNRGVLYPVYRLMMAYEKGEWLETQTLCKAMDIDETTLYRQYISAIAWTQQVLSEIY